MFCGNCGNELREGARFCPKCGAMTRQARQQEQRPVEPEQIAPPAAPEPVLEAGPVQEPMNTNEPAPGPAAEQEAAPAPSAPHEQVRRQRPAAGRVKQAVRLKAMPVRSAQDAKSTPQAEQAKPSSPPPSPEPVESPQQPATPTQPSFLETGAAHFASADSDKDTLNDTRVQCGNCGTELKAGTKYCPECGMPAGWRPTEESAPAIDSQEHRAPAFGAFSGFGRTKEARSPQTGTTVEARPKANPNKRLVKFAAIVGAFVVVIVLLAALGSGSGSKYADGLVEANGAKYADGLVEADNFQGLSTIITLDEAINYYNKYLADVNGISNIDTYESKLQLTKYGGLVTDCNSKDYFDDLNMTAYYYSNPIKVNGRTEWIATFGVDSKTNCLITVQFQQYDYDALLNGGATDTEISYVVPENMPEQFMALVYAAAGGDAQKASEWMQQLYEQNREWNKGVVLSYEKKAVTTSYRCSFMTKEAYEEEYDDSQ